jgi:hypothetical protein
MHGYAKERIHDDHEVGGSTPSTPTPVSWEFVGSSDFSLWRRLPRQGRSNGVGGSQRLVIAGRPRCPRLARARAMSAATARGTQQGWSPTGCSGGVVDRQSSSYRYPRVVGRQCHLDRFSPELRWVPFGHDDLSGEVTRIPNRVRQTGDRSCES